HVEALVVAVIPAVAHGPAVRDRAAVYAPVLEAELPQAREREIDLLDDELARGRIDRIEAVDVRELGVALGSLGGRGAGAARDIGRGGLAGQLGRQLAAHVARAEHVQLVVPGQGQEPARYPAPGRHVRLRDVLRLDVVEPSAIFQ